MRKYFYVLQVLEKLNLKQSVETQQIDVTWVRHSSTLNKLLKPFRKVTSVPTLKTRTASSQEIKFNVTKEGISKYQTILACGS